MMEPETVAFEPDSPEGRSWSSISDSGSGLISEFPEFPTESETRSLSSEAIPSLDSVLSSRNRTSELPQRRFAKAANRGVTESSPHARYRTSPYPTPGGRGRSMSAGSVALSRSQRGSPYGHSASPSVGLDYHQSLQGTTASGLPAMSDIDFDMFCQRQTSALPGGRFDPNSLFLPPPAEEPACDNTCTSTHTSPEIVNILHSSNAAHIHREHQFVGSSDPPNLFGPLQDDQLSPPPEDMDADESDIPRAQELRFEGDLYTPKYVRGHGNKREGWCGICKPGRWLVLKNSAFWYDKSFTHGISAATGSAFESPKETRRMKGNPDVWEGLCHGCGDWIALISSKKKGTTWFRHAYKVSPPTALWARMAVLTNESATPTKRSRTHRKGDGRSHTPKLRNRRKLQSPIRPSIGVRPMHPILPWFRSKKRSSPPPRVFRLYRPSQAWYEPMMVANLPRQFQWFIHDWQSQTAGNGPLGVWSVNVMKDHGNRTDFDSISPV